MDNTSLRLLECKLKIINAISTCQSLYLPLNDLRSLYSKSLYSRKESHEVKMLAEYAMRLADKAKQQNYNIEQELYDALEQSILSLLNKYINEPVE
jgi:hypothetical protein